MSENTPDKTPLLPEEELHDFVTAHFRRKHIYQAAVKTHGSPLWILDTAVVREKAAQFSSAFRRYFDNASFYFAMKSNNHPDVSAILLESRFGLDVSSGAELKAAIELNAKDIIFSGPGKTTEELALAVAHKDRTVILLDSFGELDRLKDLVSGLPSTSPVRVGVRLTTTPDGLWKKFGIAPEKLLEFWTRVENISNISFKGIHFHTSWNLTPDRQVEFIIRLGHLLKTMPMALNKSIEFLDIGGGYWPGEGEWLRFEGTPEGMLNPAGKVNPGPIEAHYRIPGTPIETFAQILSQTIHAHIFPLADCRICFEPGRWICHSTMHLLFSVIDKKGEDLVITDAGTNIIGWERFEIDYFPVLNLSRESSTENPCRILGSLCTPHDIWGFSYFGEDLKTGDLLMIPCQGAYTVSLGQTFIKPLPKVVKI